MIENNGISSYSVLIPARPTAVEVFAASELVRYISRVIGMKPEVVNDGQWDEGTKCISVGNTTLFLRYLNPPEDGRYDKFMIKRVRDNILLNGNNKRGVLYAVYNLLESCAGISFALADNEYVPESSAVPLPDNDVIEQAHLANREVVGHPSDTSENIKRIDYLVKNLGNSIQFTLSYWKENREAISAEIMKRGLDVTIGGHIYSEFLPEKEYFDKHPEWFPEINGVRTRGTEQICYSSKGVDILVEHIVLGFKECWTEGIRRFSLWYGDNALFCSCENCRQHTFYDHYMQLVSYIKKELEKAGIISVALDFVIYNSDNEHKSDLTLLSPNFTKRPDNINIFYSYWGRDYSQPLADSISPYDIHSYACLKEWCRLFKSADNYSRVGEYYADSNQLTAMAPVIPDRIKDDILTYKNVGIDGMHVCIHLWWSPHATYPMFWVMSFNLFAYLRFAWDHNLSTSNLFQPMLKKYFGDAAIEVDEILATIRKAVLPLTRYNLAGPVCSLAGTILWDVPYVRGGPRYSFDPDRDEFSKFRQEILIDLKNAYEIMDGTSSLFDAFLKKTHKDTVAVTNFKTYYDFCVGNLCSLLFQARAQEAIVKEDMEEARSLFLKISKLEESLYRRGIDDIRKWFEIYKYSLRVKALELKI